MKIETALNGQQAILKIEQKSYDFVFLDLHMPVLYGY